MRKSLTATAGLAVAGLLIFIAGFVIGAVEEVPSPVIVAAVAIVVVVVLAGITWVGRMGSHRR